MALSIEQNTRNEVTIPSRLALQFLQSEDRWPELSHRYLNGKCPRYFNLLDSALSERLIYDRTNEQKTLQKVLGSIIYINTQSRH